MYIDVNEDKFVLDFIDYRYEFLKVNTNKQDMMRATPYFRAKFAHKVYNKTTQLFEKERHLGISYPNELLEFSRGVYNV